MQVEFEDINETTFGNLNIGDLFIIEESGLDRVLFIKTPLLDSPGKSNSLYLSGKRRGNHSRVDLDRGVTKVEQVKPLKVRRV